jgi:hypothetical protein
MKSLSYALRVPVRSVAIITALALLAWTMGLPAWIHTANAASLENISDTLSVDASATTGASAPGANAMHTIQFDTPNGMIATHNLRISFDPTTALFDLTGLTAADIRILSGATYVSGVGSCSGAASEMYPTVNAETVDFTVCAGDTIASSTSFIIEIGSTTANMINNPGVVDDYVIQIGGDAASTAPDSGDTRVAIVDEVTVTAAVDTIFTFSVNPVLSGTTVNDEVTVTSTTTTATAIPFGILAPNTPKFAAQELRVDTNALNGFSVTVQADQTLTAGNGATIDEFIDGAATASSTGWVGPTGTVGQTDEYGHWAVTSDDDEVSSTTPNLWGGGEALYAGNFIDNPVEVFYHNTATEQTAGVGVGSTTVAYKVEIMELQEAAKDYTATLTYIATPVF